MTNQSPPQPTQKGKPMTGYPEDGIPVRLTDKWIHVYLLQNDKVHSDSGPLQIQVTLDQETKQILTRIANALDPDGINTDE